MTANTSLPRGEIIQQMDGAYELFPVSPDQETLLAILKDCLKEWEHIRIGPLIPGAIWEIKPPGPPRFGFQDGYVTMDFGSWHSHLCIGETKSAPPDVAKHRRTGRAELYRRLNPDLQPTSWGFRMFIPNPPMDPDGGREDSGRREGVAGAMIRTRIRVDGRLAGGRRRFWGRRWRSAVAVLSEMAG